MTARLGRLHVITDATLQARYSHVALAELAARGGADVIQFREKRDWTTARRVATAREINAVLARTDAMLIVDDRVDVCAAVGAFGVHLGRHDLPVETARSLLGPEACIGGTANSVLEAAEVAARPVDYLGVGPVFGTRSKARPAPTLGLKTLARIVRATALPVIAIGSIDATNVAEVLSTGAHGVAVLGAVACAADPAEATARIREAITFAYGRDGARCDDGGGTTPR